MNWVCKIKAREIERQEIFINLALVWKIFAISRLLFTSIADNFLMYSLTFTPTEFLSNK